MFLLEYLVQSQFYNLDSFYTIYKSFKSGVKSVIKLDVSKDKKIKIIRGVPGSGKRNYVYYLENGLNR